MSGRLLGKGAALKNAVPRCECTAKVLKRKEGNTMDFLKEGHMYLYIYIFFLLIFFVR